MFSTYFARKWPNNFGCLTFLPCSSLYVKHDHWSTNICLTPDTSGLWCSLYINGWLLLHWRREKRIKTKDTLTWVQESKSLVVSIVDFFPSIPHVHSHCKLEFFKISEKQRVNTLHYTIIISTLEANKPNNSLPRTRSWELVTRSCPTKSAW